MKIEFKKRVNCPICKCGTLVLFKTSLTKELFGTKQRTFNKELIKNKNYVIRVCLNCGLKFQELVFKNDTSAEFYYNNFIPKSKKRNVVLLKTSKKFKVNNFKRILDYGAGSGFLSELLKADTYELGQPKPKKKYDLIILNDVLEHVSDLFKVMEDIKKYSSLGCYIYVNVPNCNNIKINKNYFPDKRARPLEHINLFTNKSLFWFFYSNGFEKINIFEFLKNFNNINSTDVYKHFRGTTTIFKREVL